MQLRQAHQRRRPVRLVEQDFDVKKPKETKPEEGRVLNEAQKDFLKRIAKVEYVKSHYTCYELTRINREMYHYERRKKVSRPVDLWRWLEHWNAKGLKEGYDWLPMK
ncbi:hypothetical protein CAEBREN_14323 [Caenorhabditis brenneri]|uniref:Uncharacterized protein n=1 Tax=Caenorhabditis brenneri TaxID=135651 RepID=G0NKZ0_CAEBE|nr:hypothetical protein CAEBREN_14323 [Caenorhabditis brenneri]